MAARSPRASVTAAVRRARLLAASLRNPGRLNPGPDFSAGTGLRVGRGRTLTTGTRVHIGNNFFCMATVTCGSDVMISSNVSVVGNDHPFDSSDRTLYDFERNPYAEVVIEGDNLIGFGTSIVGPLTIGFGAIVGTGSVVTKDLEPNGIYAGVPARRIGTRR